jgi:hypothetical protein
MNGHSFVGSQGARDPARRLAEFRCKFPAGGRMLLEDILLAVAVGVVLLMVGVPIVRP